jgi:hypothetical protein
LLLSVCSDFSENNEDAKSPLRTDWADIAAERVALGPDDSRLAGSTQFAEHVRVIKPSQD